jgi:hypothetical protein
VEGGFEFPGARTGEKRSNRGDGNEKNERERGVRLISYERRQQ